MNPYIEKLIQELSAYEDRCKHRGEISPLDILWDYYISVNPPDDGSIQQAEDAMLPIHQALPIPLSDTLSFLVGDLVYAYSRSAFLEGIRLGMHLQENTL